jgi:uncharacterized beta-barrel protein YwiB (DUF1934 family)
LEKQVTIHLQTVIEDNGQKETNSSNQIGKFYRKDKMDVITFEEKTEDNHRIKSFITIHPEKVNIKRSGIISMNQQFHKEKITENVYTHPHGNIHMETYTNSIDYQALSNQQDGQLNIDYTVKLNGQEERKHKLTLTLKKEDAE